jgi:hypothetical protein
VELVANTQTLGSLRLMPDESGQMSDNGQMFVEIEGSKPSVIAL